MNSGSVIYIYMCVCVFVCWVCACVCIHGVGETGHRARVRVIFVLREYIWNALAVFLVLLPFNDTGSLGPPPRQVVYPFGSMVPPWITASRSLVRNREAELKPTTFSSPTFLCFPVFPLLRTPQRYSTLECCLLGLLL